MNVAVLMGTLSLALFNASKDEVARNFAYIYALISVGILVSSCLICNTTSRICFLIDVALALRLCCISKAHYHDTQT